MDEQISGTEKTLGQAISRLEEISWQINGKVFGERPETAKNMPTPVAADVVSRARNRIVEITGRLEDVLGRLEVLGN